MSEHNHAHHEHLNQPENFETTVSPEVDHETIHQHNDHSNHYQGHRTAFHFEEQIQILFSSLNLTDKNQLVTACVIFAILAFFNESLKLARAKIQIKMKPKQFLNITCTQKIFNGWHFLQTILHCFQMVISYALMLVFMTFQGWLCLSIIIGSTVGYFVFGWAHMSFNSNCG